MKIEEFEEDNNAASPAASNVRKKRRAAAGDAVADFTPGTGRATGLKNTESAVAGVAVGVTIDGAPVDAAPAVVPSAAACS